MAGPIDLYVREVDARHVESFGQEPGGRHATAAPEIDHAGARRQLMEERAKPAAERRIRETKVAPRGPIRPIDARRPVPPARTSDLGEADGGARGRRLGLLVRRVVDVALIVGDDDAFAFAFEEAGLADDALGTVHRDGLLPAELELGRHAGSSVTSGN